MNRGISKYMVLFAAVMEAGVVFFVVIVFHFSVAS